MIQLEGIFLKRVTNNIVDAFEGVEKMLWETFLSRLFFVKSKSLSLIKVNLSIMPFNTFGLGLLNPMTSTNKKYLIFQHASTELI